MKTGHFVSRLGIFAAVFASLLLLPGRALAHAVLVSSSPSAHASVKGPEIAIHLKFNSRIDGAHSRLYLVGPDGKVKTLVLEAQSAPDALSAQSIKLGAGEYIIRWQALASDGHITRGEIPFTVQ
ncbi:MAG: copper resistance protein CopC [Acidobacterium ailaaui]|jgi:methionine-rich copper-binding protein CopC|nr:copper resistance protein CopC [Pseudacidobacterium ailaaui]MCL6464880.1 copper resistance protein CopC [Pseudacidobacterium ailaaui]MDI3255598.1 copper resistance protein CopC [Bacillota bacterium]